MDVMINEKEINLPAEVATPSMTTIRQPLKEMGWEAAERVVQAIRRGAGKPDRDRLHGPAIDHPAPRRSRVRAGPPSEPGMRTGRQIRS